MNPFPTLRYSFIPPHQPPQDIARNHVVHFQCLVDIFHVFESLCARNDHFATIAKESMRTISHSSSTT